MQTYAAPELRASNLGDARLDRHLRAGIESAYNLTRGV